MNMKVKEIYSVDTGTALHDKLGRTTNSKSIIIIRRDALHASLKTPSAVDLNTFAEK